MKIAFLCPYFGKFPDHFQLWINSCSTNDDCTFFLYTDDKRIYNYPNNFVVKYMTLAEFKKIAEQRLGFEVSLNGAYKLGDFKPVLGFIFEDKIKNYDAWGHLDVPDEIMGCASDFITDHSFDNCDKLMARGHMTIYKNSYDTNRRFMEPNGESFNYKDILISDQFYNFEELGKGSINYIYRYNNHPLNLYNDAVADLSGLYYGFRRSDISDDFKYYRASKVPSIYSRENGKTYGYFLENNQVIKREYLYVHFKRRKMSINVPLNSDRFLITPAGFFPYEEITTEVIRKKGKGKLFYHVYFEEKMKGLKRRLHIK